MMTWKFPAASTLAVSFAATVVVMGAFSAANAQQTKLKYDKDGHVDYGRSGPNVVIQQGPHTRVFITKRSWLDAGTEVLPGDRKFTDYAFPSPFGYPDFARENNNRPIDRQPLNPPSDLGGEPTKFPLY
jgi:hypothetical protein